MASPSSERPTPVEILETLLADLRAATDVSQIAKPISIAVAGLWGQAEKDRARIAELEGETKELTAQLAHCRQSLVDQAAARLDPTMPLLTQAVLDELKGSAEAGYSLAETRDERVAAHGLSLLCDWQAAAGARKESETAAASSLSDGVKDR